MALRRTRTVPAQGIVVDSDSIAVPEAMDRQRSPSCGWKFGSKNVEFEGRISRLSLASSSETLLQLAEEKQFQSSHPSLRCWRLDLHFVLVHVYRSGLRESSPHHRPVASLHQYLISSCPSWLLNWINSLHFFTLHFHWLIANGFKPTFIAVTLNPTESDHQDVDKKIQRINLQK